MISEHELYKHVGMSVEQLDRRGKELSISLREIDHFPQRKTDIQHELSCISLELWCLHRDGELEIVPITPE